MFIIAKINPWQAFILLDSTVHDDADAAKAHLAAEAERIGEYIVSEYRVFALAEQA